MFQRTGWIISWCVCPKNNSGKRKNLVCRNCFTLHDAKPLLSQQYLFKLITNERTNDRIVNNTFEEIDAFSKLIILFKIFKQGK